MDDHPDCVSTCTPLQNQICYATWVTYTWVALLLRRPFLAIESCFVHLWRNQVVDYFKLKSRDGVFGWKFIKDFPSSHIHKCSKLAHTQMEKVWSRIKLILVYILFYILFKLILVHNNLFFFKLFDVCLCNVLVLWNYFFSTSVALFKSTESVDSVGTTIFTLPKVISLFIFYRYQFNVCLFSNVCQECVFLVFFFFQLSYDFF